MLFYRATSEVRVGVTVRRHATAEKPHTVRAGPQLVPGTGRDQDRVALPHHRISPSSSIVPPPPTSR